MAMSYLALDMRNPRKCVTVSYPPETKLEVLYEVFDADNKRLNSGVQMPDGPLSQSKVTLEISPAEHNVHINLNDPRNNHSENLSEPFGKIRYQAVGVGGGPVEVCVMIQQLPGRKYPRPTLVGLRARETGLEDEEYVDPVNNVDKEGQSAAREHMTELEKILSHMIRETNFLMSAADMIKMDEVAFHKKSNEMNAASMWWPILHVCVLLVTGFTQANHVAKFFKSRHII
jgi:hypothetical protein